MMNTRSAETYQDPWYETDFKDGGEHIEHQSWQDKVDSSAGQNRTEAAHKLFFVKMLSWEKLERHESPWLTLSLYPLLETWPLCVDWGGRRGQESGGGGMSTLPLCELRSEQLWQTLRYGVRWTGTNPIWQHHLHKCHNQSLCRACTKTLYHTFTMQVNNYTQGEEVHGNKRYTVKNSIVYTKYK